MLAIAGYHITETLHVDSKTLVYRGYRDEDRCPVILKTLNPDTAEPNDLARLEHEYTLTKDWQENEQLRTITLLRQNNTKILILQDIGGVSMNHLLATGPLPLSTFLTLAVAFAHSLNRIHQQQLIHKDINPSNLVANLGTGQVQIIDFGISSQLSCETPVLQAPGHIEGTLAYLSPEQTGRMNRILDYRTDFYSLGASFYTMLTGNPPFDASDPMEMVHCHLAKMPPPIHQLRPELPPILNELVLKLMAKTAEARYQSAFGLIADLQTCLALFHDSGAAHSIAPFALGQQDISQHFQIPQKLYGRETEQAQVLTAFANISQGAAQMLMITGYSGVGKTALVHEVYKPITEKHGYFISGKFDQFQRDIPYASLIQAFQELMRQLLTETPAQIQRWKARLEQALGSNAQVIIEVIPEVEWLMGPQMAVPELPPSQMQNRFNLTFQQFIRSFTDAQHPLVLFLDDLQWTDSPSLHLLELIMSTPETQYLLLIGAYRNNEVHAAHPLMLTLEAIANNSASPLPTLALLPLDHAHIQQLLADTFHCPLEPCAALADLCLEKTLGNPFFLGQFLRTLTETRQILFNHEIGRWQWDIATLQKTPITNNVIELLTTKIQTLPPETQTVLQLAACVGNQFDLNTLAWIYEKSTLATTQAIWPALQEQLLAPLDQGGYRYLTNELVHTSNPSFRFVHDRVQQAAYSLIGDDSKAVSHLRIGRRLLANMKPSEREERIFDLVYHLNKGQDLLTLASEKEELAQLNLLAGEKAKSSAAYKPALNYLQAGLKLIGAESWEQQYDLTLALSVAATEAAYLSGDFEQMDALVKVVLQETKTLLEQVKVYQIQISARILQNRSLDAIKLALPVLKQLGIKLPAKPTVLHVLQGLMEAKLALMGKKIEDLANLQPMTHTSSIAATQILSSIAPAIYFAMPNLLPVVFCKQVCLSAKHGNVALSSYAYAGYGVILCGVLGDIESGYQFGKLALKVLEQFETNAFKVKVVHLVENLIKHWKDPYHSGLTALQDAYQSGVQTGDFEYAAYVGFNYGHFLYFTGKELPQVQRELEKYAQAMAQFKQEPTLQWQKVTLQAVANLMGQNDNPCHLQGSHFDENTNPIPEGNRFGIFMHHSHAMILCYLFEDYSQALKHAITAKKYLDGALAHMILTLSHFYMALVQLAMLSEIPKNQQGKLLRQAASIQKKFKQWAHHAPANNLHKWHLVEAERQRIAGADLSAMNHYDQAIALAKKHDFPQEAALANELAARFHLAGGREQIARMYLLNAHYGYQQWGAIAKVNQLEAKYPELLTRNARKPPQLAMPITTTHVLTAGVLDLATVMKASQSISGEIVLERLLEKLMRISIENAGAERGFLLLETEGEWRIEAEGNVNDAAVQVLQSRPLIPNATTKRELDAPMLPVSLIQYVALSKKTVLLDNACRQGQFVNDPAIIQGQLKSVMCAPILHQRKLAGILYLENNLMEGAFTTDRIDVLRILSSQAAISIENARIYENLETTVAQRTAALSSAYTAAETARQHAENAEHQATLALEELRTAQTQLVQSAKMASLGHLVAGVAHELNTPIGNALTTASVLADSNQQLKIAINKDEIRKALLVNYVEDAVLMTDVISRSCQRAANLITSFKQVAVDQTSEQRRIFDLNLLVEDNIMALQAGFTHAHWVIKTDIPANIECDSYPGPLGQVIANLVKNAAAHAFAGRESGRLHIAATPTHESVNIIFSDDGVGMDANVLSHIFEPFYTTQMGLGPGLGLSISLNIVTGVLGGTLEASSKPDCGSQFTLCFPLKAPNSSKMNTGFSDHSS